VITSPKAIVAGVLAFCALGIAAAEITTSIDGVPSEPRVVPLVARRIDGPAAPVEIKVTVPGTSDVALSEGLWEIRVNDETLWAAPVYVRNVDPAIVRLWPADPLTGSSNGITKLRAQFASLEPDGASGEADCAVAQNAWTCNIPRGRYDLRFSAPGTAPEFRSNVTVKPGASELALRFVAGASLSGRVDADDQPVEGAEVTLRASGPQQVARADRKGFFQFKGLAAGEYSISAKKQLLIAQTRSVKVLAGVAAEVREPLLLDTPKQLTLIVIPPLDPEGEAWRLHFTPTESNVTIEDRASAIGSWTRTGLVAGSYDLTILDGRGGRWKSESLTIGSDDVTLPVAASGVKVRGRVLLGGRPLRAKLSFGGEWGRALESDDDGRFAGEIPVDENDERLIFVEADTPNVVLTVRAKIERNESGESHLLLELPATTLMGRVLTDDGSSAPHALITVSGGADAFEQAFAGSDGTFQIAGLAPGTYKVVADSHERKSKPLSVDLKANEPAEVELVLEREELLRGKMTMGETPVIAATIFVLPRDAWGPIVPQTKTNERGNFQLRLPPGTTIFDGIAVHPAFDTVIARGTVRPDRVAWVPTNQIGGTLIVESREPDNLLLLHKGAEVLARTVANLGGGTVAPDRVTLARLEPGEYAVCSRDKKVCASGYLPPHGMLTLAAK